MEGGVIIVESCALEVPESNGSTLPLLLFYLYWIWTFFFSHKWVEVFMLRLSLSIYHRASLNYMQPEHFQIYIRHVATIGIASIMFTTNVIFTYIICGFYFNDPEVFLLSVLLLPSLLSSSHDLLKQFWNYEPAFYITKYLLTN